MISNHFLNYATPSNLNYNWSFGSLAGIFFALQIITGVILAMHYTPHVEWAFSSVEHIMTDVTGGYVFRYFHANGASFIFILIYAHMARNIYFQSFITRRVLWNSGVVIFLLMMATAFIGYVLPWGQMSFWGATVITSLVTAVPFVGEDIAYWVWGGFSINNATLTRFFSVHYLLPFLIVGIVGLHLTLLHTDGSSDPLSLGRTPTKITFHPYYTIKDAFILMGAFMLFAVLVSYSPNLLGHSDNFIPANPLVTPAHIVPEWYFTPFYAILRACPNKLGGAISMFAAIILLFVLPYYIDSLGAAAAVVLAPHSDLHKGVFWAFGGVFLTLMFLGLRAAAEPYVVASKLFTCLYFLYFLLATPIVTRLNAAALLRRSGTRKASLETRRKIKTTARKVKNKKVGVRYFSVSSKFVLPPAQSQPNVPPFHKRFVDYVTKNPRPLFYAILLAVVPLMLPAVFLVQIAAKGALQAVLFVFSKAITALSANILPALAAIFALRVPTAAHPVSALIALFGLFVTAVIILITNHAEYLGLVFLIVYVGAIAILFLFVILLLNLSASTTSLKQIVTQEYGKVVAVLLTAGFCLLTIWKLSDMHFLQSVAKDGELAALELLETNVTYQINKETELFLLRSLYGSEAPGFAVITMVLLFSLVGALVLSRLASDADIKKSFTTNFTAFPVFLCLSPEQIETVLKLWFLHGDDIVFFSTLYAIANIVIVVQIRKNLDKIAAFELTYRRWKPTIFEVLDRVLTVVCGITGGVFGIVWFFSDTQEPSSCTTTCTCLCDDKIIAESAMARNVEATARADTILVFSEVLSPRYRGILGELAVRKALELCQEEFTHASLFFPRNTAAEMAPQCVLQGSKGALTHEEKAHLLEKLRPCAVSEYVSPWIPPHRAIRTDYLNGRLIYAPWWKPWPDTIWLSEERLAARPEGQLTEPILERAIAGKEAPLYHDTPAIIKLYTLSKEGGIKLAADCREIERQQWEFDRRQSFFRHVRRAQWLQAKTTLLDARQYALARHEEISAIPPKTIQFLLEHGQDKLIKKVEADVLYVHGLAGHTGNLNFTLKVLEKEHGDEKGSARYILNKFVEKKGVAKLMAQPQFYDDASDDEKDMGVSHIKESMFLPAMFISSSEIFKKLFEGLVSYSHDLTVFTGLWTVFTCLLTTAIIRRYKSRVVLQAPQKSWGTLFWESLTVFPTVFPAATSFVGSWGVWLYFDNTVPLAPVMETSLPQEIDDSALAPTKEEFEAAIKELEEEQLQREKEVEKIISYSGVHDQCESRAVFDEFFRRDPDGKNQKILDKLIDEGRRKRFSFVPSKRLPLRCYFPRMSDLEYELREAAAPLHYGKLYLNPPKIPRIEGAITNNSPTVLHVESAAALIPHVPMRDESPEVVIVPPATVSPAVPADAIYNVIYETPLLTIEEILPGPTTIAVWQPPANSLEYIVVPYLGNPAPLYTDNIVREELCNLICNAADRLERYLGVIQEDIDRIENMNWMIPNSGNLKQILLNEVELERNVVHSCYEALIEQTIVGDDELARGNLETVEQAVRRTIAVGEEATRWARRLTYTFELVGERNQAAISVVVATHGNLVQLSPLRRPDPDRDENGRLIRPPSPSPGPLTWLDESDTDSESEAEYSTDSEYESPPALGDNAPR